MHIMPKLRRKTNKIMETIKLLTPGRPVPIQIGTEVRLKVQPRLTDGSIFDVEALQDIIIKVAGAKTVYEHTIEDGFISLVLPATEIEGVYDVFMEATIDDRPVCCAWNDLYSRVRYSNCINYDEYRCDFLVIGSTDEELEAMKRAAEAKKQDYIEAHAEAVAARDAYIAKTEVLDGVAKETTSQTILSKLDAIHIDLTPVLQAITLAKETILSGVDAAKSFLVIKLNDAVTTLGGWFTSGKQEILTAIAKGGGNPSKMAYEAMKRLQEYLYAIEYSELDYESARAHLIAQFGGACTCVWKDGKLGRNYDYNINYAMDYLVRVKAHNGKAASIGCASVPELTKDNYDIYSDEYKYLPFRALDGMNEHGLAVAILLLNTTVHNPNGNTPLVEERETISAAMLDRYILDNFKTATEAMQYIRDYVRVKPIQHNGSQKDVHFMVADKTDCYALEFIGTEVFATHLGGVGELPAIMANFLVSNLHAAQGVVYFDNLEDYAQGVERYQIAQEYLQGTGDLMTLMSGSLKYTNLYTNAVTKWLTDCSGDGVTYKDTAALTARWGEYHDFYVSKTKEELREDGRMWQTVHSVVYDLEARTMQIVTQESGVDNVIEYDVVGKLPTTKEDLAPLAKEGTVSNGFRNLDTIIREAVSTIKNWVTNKTNDILSAIHAIPEPDLSSVAKEATLQGVSGKVGTFTDPTETVAHKLENLTFDKTDLAKEATTAKQGSNPNISLTSLDAKLGNVVMGTDSEFEQSLEYINSQLV